MRQASYGSGHKLLAVLFVIMLVSNQEKTPEGGRKVYYMFSKKH